MTITILLLPLYQQIFRAASSMCVTVIYRSAQSNFTLYHFNHRLWFQPKQYIMSTPTPNCLSKYIMWHYMV